MLSRFSPVFLFVAAILSGTSLSAEVLSIGHRGNSMFAPENTVASFRSALGKADFVETDVYPSSDGVLVIMHDSTVDRTTDGTGKITSKTLAELKSLDAGSWFSTNFIGERIPTLEEMITNVIDSATPLIEQKAGPASAYVAELARLGVTTNVVVQSFNWNFLTDMHALEPSIELCALGSGTLDANTLNTISNTGARTVAWEKSAITSNEVSMVHNAGMKLFVWTVDGAQIQTFINLGVDGIISNDPGLVKQMQQPATNNVAFLGEDLIAYWRMDDGLSNPFTTSVSDSKGTNTALLTRNDGLSHWINTSPFAGGLQLSGTNGYVTFPQTETLDIGTNALTISMWVKLTQLPSQLATSYGSIYDSTTDCYVVYLDKQNKELRFKVTDVTGNAARPGIPESKLVTNEWLHIAATYAGSAAPNSGQATIYLNGQVQDVHSGSDGTSPFGLTAIVKAGQIAGMGREGDLGGSYFYGAVDDFAIWKRALSPQEIAKIFQSSQKGQAIADLVREPTTSIQFHSVQQTSGTLEINFQNLGEWQNFRLLRSTGLNEPFLEVMGINPTALGNGNYRFSYSINTNEVQFFRIEGR